MCSTRKFLSINNGLTQIILLFLFEREQTPNVRSKNSLMALKTNILMALIDKNNLWRLEASGGMDGRLFG